jgi:hypothetical protein
VLERAVRKARPAPRRETAEVVPGIALKSGRGRLVLEGPGVTSDLAEALAAWLARR